MDRGQKSRLKSVGGSETVTTYTYQKRWGSSLIKSMNSKPDGHENRPDARQGSTFVAPGLTVVTSLCRQASLT
jgi:hypothetical protein